MRIIWPVAVWLAFFPGYVTAGVNSSDAGQPFCNKSITRMNATGNHTVFAQNVQNNLRAAESDDFQPATWLKTVGQGAGGSSQADLWFNPGSVNYYNVPVGGFEACAFIWLGPLPTNTLRLGQDDPGDCSVMLSASCRSALTAILESTAISYANIAYAAGTTSSNLTSGIVPHVCTDLWISMPQTKTGNSLPAQCQQDFYPVVATEYVAVHLTSNNSTNTSSTASIYEAMHPDCPLRDSYEPPYWTDEFFFVQDLDQAAAKPDFANMGENTYQLKTRTATPIFTVYFTVQTGNNVGFPTQSSAQLTCLRTTEFIGESSVSPRLPAGRPWSSIDLSTGSIAGIVIGAVSFIAVSTALFFIFWRRKKSKQGTGDTERDKDLEDIEGEQPHELAFRAKHELSPADLKGEVDGAQILETGDAQGAVELDARPRYSFNSDGRSALSYATARSR